jgi:hypothetical protein
MTGAPSPIAATAEVLEDLDGADLSVRRFAIGRAIEVVPVSERRLLGGGPMSTRGASATRLQTAVGGERRMRDMGADARVVREPLV